MFKKGHINVERGTRSHKLVTTGKSKKRNNHSYVEVVCDCGTTKYIKFSHFKDGSTKSCGCLIREFGLSRKTISNRRLYDIYHSMLARCNNLKTSNYEDYGGRGIKVCEEWSNFKNFETWSLNNGYSDDLSIDRIDNDGNYSPENCRWADKITQANNTRTNKFVEYKGETKTIAEWCRELGLPPARTYARLRKGWSAEKAFETENLRKSGAC